jgi:hypothetical protein
VCELPIQVLDLCQVVDVGDLVTAPAIADRQRVLASQPFTFDAAIQAVRMLGFLARRSDILMIEGLAPI